MFSTVSTARGTGLAARGPSPGSPWAWRRARLAGDARRLARPVVSVGNLAPGGRGKTPVAALVARILVEAGERPAILTRGYARRRREDGVVVVSDGRRILADLDRAGDEPLMLARDVPGAGVFVCDQRALAGTLAERAFGATVHVLDDGFQHAGLARDVDLVLVGPGDLVDRPLPFGGLREPVSALAWADAIIEDADAGPAADSRPPALAAPVPDGVRRFTLHRAPGAAVPLEPERSPVVQARPVMAIAGLADPARFFRALEAAGWRLARTRAFRDHHDYRAADLARVAREAAEAGAAAVVTSAKDAVRLRPLRPLPLPVAAVPLEVRVEPAGTFREWLLARLAGARA